MSKSTTPKQAQVIDEPKIAPPTQITATFNIGKETTNNQRLEGIKGTAVFGSLYIPLGTLPENTTSATVTVVFHTKT